MENSNSTSNVLSEEMQLWEKLDGPLPFRLTNAYLFVAVLQKNNESLCSPFAYPKRRNSVSRSLESDYIGTGNR